MAATFLLKILTPNGVFFDSQAEGLIVRTTVGDKGILAKHEPYVAALVIGKLKVKIDGTYRIAAISSGVIRVDPKETIILADSCEWADEINIERAEGARQKAENKLAQEGISGIDIEIAEFKLKRALNRIDTYIKK